MRIGVLADVHGNANALAAVLQAAREAEVAHLCVAGDIVGYYYEPARCLDLLDGWSWDAVRGNHEDLLAASGTDAAMAARLHAMYGSGLAVARETLSAGQLAVLDAWPRTRELTFGRLRVLLCHGAPWDTDAYLYPDAPAADFERCARTGADIVILGHTHYVLDRTVRQTRIVNPGSVGQPRDRRPGAAWMVLDSETGGCEWRRESYDLTPVLTRAREQDPHLAYLRDVLTRTVDAKSERA